MLFSAAFTAWTWMYSRRPASPSGLRSTAFSRKVFPLFSGRSDSRAISCASSSVMPLPIFPAAPITETRDSRSSRFVVMMAPPETGAPPETIVRWMKANSCTEGTR